MDKYVKEFFLFIFVIALGAFCIYLGMNLREVTTYTCVYTYEKQGIYETERHYVRGIECAANTTDPYPLCRGGDEREVHADVSFVTVDADVRSVGWSGAFVDGININTTSLYDTMSMN